MLVLLLLVAVTVEARQRIVGGVDAEPHTHPWQVSLRRVTSEGQSHFCGGVILNENYVLTAAHCLTAYPANEVKVTAGGHFLQSQSEFETESFAESLILHESYDGNAQGFPNDIALIKLATPISENGGIQYGGLPVDDSSDYSGSSGCYITGWGRTIAGGALPNALQETPISILTNSDCKSRLSILLYFALRDTHICTYGGGTSSACNGDSGGPAVCDDGNGGKVVVGVTSWGEANCPQNKPSVYTRLSKYLTWINSKMV
ncbi:hypothetical protein LOTGIDRAFT_207774 [Lottia gigantea]|uniref:Peptidase S1 domain-containing protein n=1 Tax=Lottia gigantea TaxID=225164 RepID=V4ATZ4_LOTGI|nr:hypothetical protein LOTGIDRAFT_207774 [Lottia gigantea]ESP00778.1 hypothetical protein LOTGIDRAFT_207774 [Lottia gigantea]